MSSWPEDWKIKSNRHGKYAASEYFIFVGFYGCYILEACGRGRKQQTTQKSYIQIICKA